MSGFTFSDETLDDLERIRGAYRTGRGRVDHAGNRRLVQAISGTAAALSKAARSKQATQFIDGVASKVPQVVVKVTGRTHGSGNTLGAFIYVSRLSMADQEVRPLETSEGRSLTRSDDMMQLARDWHQWELADEARRKGATALSTVFSMPPGTDPGKVRDAVRDVAETEMGNHRWVMVLHTDEDHPHVHLIIANCDNDGRRFNPGRDFLNHLRESFAENLRARGIEADASRRIARGYPLKRETMIVEKMRERSVVPLSDATKIEALNGGSAEGREHIGERKKALSRTTANLEQVREVYGQAIIELEA